MTIKRGRDCLELFLLPMLLLLTSLIALQCRDSAGFCFPLQAVLWPVQGQAGVEWSNLRHIGTWWDLQPVGTWWISFGPGETSWDLLEALCGHNFVTWGTLPYWGPLSDHGDPQNGLPFAKFSKVSATYLFAFLWVNFTRILEFSWSPPLAPYWLLVG